MLEVTHVSFDYLCQGLSRHTSSLLHDISWQLPAGGMMHLQGANGSGKTTFLKLLAGILQPDEGVICYEGSDIGSQQSTYQQAICYLGHKAGISQALTVVENGWYDLKTPWNQRNFDTHLQRLSLFEVKDLPCYLLSAGQKRRVGLLRLMISTAQLWLLDEPLVALDAEGVALLMALLKAHVLSGGSVVYSSHQPLPWGDQRHQVCLL